VWFTILGNEIWFLLLCCLMETPGMLNWPTIKSLKIWENESLFTISWLNRWSYFSLGETHIFDIPPYFYDLSIYLFQWANFAKWWISIIILGLGLWDNTEKFLYNNSSLSSQIKIKILMLVQFFLKFEGFQWEFQEHFSWIFASKTLKYSSENP
jgi:hypothetical protein